MEFRAVHNAEIEARLAQSHRYDILHAAVDDCLAGAPRNWNRRLVCGLLLENMLVITPQSSPGAGLIAVIEDLHNHTSNEITWAIARISAGALLAFLMEFSEFLVLCKTSSLTLSIAGIFKDICQLALAVTIRKDHLSVINYIGLIICLAGIVCHLLHKYSNMKEMQRQQELQLDNDQEESSPGSTNSTMAVPLWVSM